MEIPNANDGQYYAQLQKEAMLDDKLHQNDPETYRVVSKKWSSNGWQGAFTIIAQKINAEIENAREILDAETDPERKLKLTGVIDGLRIAIQAVRESNQ